MSEINHQIRATRLPCNEAKTEHEDYTHCMSIFRDHRFMTQKSMCTSSESSTTAANNLDFNNASSIASWHDGNLRLNNVIEITTLIILVIHIIITLSTIIHPRSCEMIFYIDQYWNHNFLIGSCQLTVTNRDLTT